MRMYKKSKQPFFSGMQLIAKVTFLFFLVFSMVPSSIAEDLTPPSVSNIQNVYPSVATGSVQQFTLTASAGAGIDFLSLFLQAQGGGNISGPGSYYPAGNLISGDNRSGQWKLSMTIPQTASAGTYSVCIGVWAIGGQLNTGCGPSFTIATPTPTPTLTPTPTPTPTLTPTPTPTPTSAG